MPYEMNPFVTVGAILILNNEFGELEAQVWQSPGKPWWLPLLSPSHEFLMIFLLLVQLCSKRMGRLVVVTNVSFYERFTRVNSMRSIAMQCSDACSD